MTGYELRPSSASPTAAWSQCSTARPEAQASAAGAPALTSAELRAAGRRLLAAIAVSFAAGLVAGVVVGRQSR